MGLWANITDFVSGSRLGYQTANVMLERDEALATARITANLNDSRASWERSASYVAVSDIEIELDGTNTGGLTIQARVRVRTTNTGTSVTPRIFNVTDAVAAVTGAAYSTDTNFDDQTLSFTPVSGVKKYRLEITGSNATDDIQGIGYIEHYVASP